MSINYRKRVINNKIASEIKADPKEVNIVFDSLAELLTKHIETLDPRRFRITHLGSFKAKPFRRWVLNNSSKYKQLKLLGFIPELRSEDEQST